MNSKRNRLYLLISLACLVGYVWVGIQIKYDLMHHSDASICFIKNVTDIPCPSCGSTRSVISLLKGDFWKAIQYNPLGYLIVAIMLFTPVWIVIDLAKNSDSFLNAYYRFEKSLRKPMISIPLVLIMIINWIWNITKGL